MALLWTLLCAICLNIDLRAGGYNNSTSSKMYRDAISKLALSCSKYGDEAGLGVPNIVVTQILSLVGLDSIRSISSYCFTSGTLTRIGYLDNLILYSMSYTWTTRRWIDISYHIDKDSNTVTAISQINSPDRRHDTTLYRAHKSEHEIAFFDQTGKKRVTLVRDDGDMVLASDCYSNYDTLKLQRLSSATILAIHRKCRYSEEYPPPVLICKCQSNGGSNELTQSSIDSCSALHELRADESDKWTLVIGAKTSNATTIDIQRSGKDCSMTVSHSGKIVGVIKVEAY